MNTNLIVLMMKLPLIYYMIVKASEYVIKLMKSDLLINGE